jgi:acetyl-CoA carboxylase biotin carboxyl carrier protein
MDFFMVDEIKIKKLSELLDKYDLNEIEVKSGFQTVRVVKKPASYAISGHAVMDPVSSVAQAMMTSGSSQDGAADAAECDDGKKDHYETVKSPMVGTIYTAPEPGAAPFAMIGDQVKAGQTILIVEAMKVMNQIKATKTGILKDVLVENEEPVEFDQPLFHIDA